MKILSWLWRFLFKIQKNMEKPCTLCPIYFDVYPLSSEVFKTGPEETWANLNNLKTGWVGLSPLEVPSNPKLLYDSLILSFTLTYTKLRTWEETLLQNQFFSVSNYGNRYHFVKEQHVYFSASFRITSVEKIVQMHTFMCMQKIRSPFYPEPTEAAVLHWD